MALAQLSYLFKNSDRMKESTVKSLNNATKFYLLGHLYNVLDEYHREAEENLSRAVKLNPRNIDGWNSLGECFWKKGDLNTARLCFSSALEHMKNKSSLRSLSMVLRQLGEDDKARRSNISQSVELAKQAVALDVEDGISWMILGNAYLSFMFNCSLKKEDLNKALNAYEKAKFLPKSSNHPDLYYNQSTLYRYLEKYQEAFDGFTKASSLDPKWTEPAKALHSLQAQLTKTSELLSKKGRMKQKTFETKIRDVEKEVLRVVKNLPGNMFYRKIKDINEGENLNAVMILKIISEVVTEDKLGYFNVVVDEDGEVFVLSLYNFAVGSVKVDDLIIIRDPVLIRVNIKLKDVTYSYLSVRVENPNQMVCNGRPLPPSSIVHPSLSLQRE